MREFCCFLEKESVVNLDLRFGSHDLFAIVLHSVRYIPVFDDVVNVIDARIGQAELIVRRF